MTTSEFTKLMLSLTTVQTSLIRAMVDRSSLAGFHINSFTALEKRGIIHTHKYAVPQTSAAGYPVIGVQLLTSLGYQLAWEYGFMGEWNAYAEELSAVAVEQAHEAAIFEDMEEHSDPRSWLTWTEIQMRRVSSTPEEVWEAAYNYHNTHYPPTHLTPEEADAIVRTFKRAGLGWSEPRSYMRDVDAAWDEAHLAHFTLLWAISSMAFEDALLLKPNTASKCGVWASDYQAGFDAAVGKLYVEAHAANALVCAWERGKAERAAAQAEINAALRARAYADGAADRLKGEQEDFGGDPNPYKGAEYYSWEPIYKAGWMEEYKRLQACYDQAMLDYTNGVYKPAQYAHSPILLNVYKRGHDWAAEMASERAAERANERYWEDRGEGIDERENALLIRFEERLRGEVAPEDAEAYYVRDPFFARLYAIAEEEERKSERAWLAGAPARQAAQAQARAAARDEIPF